MSGDLTTPGVEGSYDAFGSDGIRKLLLLLIAVAIGRRLQFKTTHFKPLIGLGCFILSWQSAIFFSISPEVIGVTVCICLLVARDKGLTPSIQSDVRLAK